jgi:hypothetical protein
VSVRVFSAISSREKYGPTALVAGASEGLGAARNHWNKLPDKSQNRLEPKPQLPEQVAEECLKQIGTTPSFVSGTGNKVVSFLMRHLFPLKKAITIMGDGMMKMYGIRP